MKPAKPKSCRVWCVVNTLTGDVVSVRFTKCGALADAHPSGVYARVVPATLQFSTPKKKGKSHAK